MTRLVAEDRRVATRRHPGAGYSRVQRSGTGGPRGCLASAHSPRPHGEVARPAHRDGEHAANPLGIEAELDRGLELVRNDALDEIRAAAPAELRGHGGAPAFLPFAPHEG